MADPRFVVIAQGLLAKTRDRKVDWRRSNTGVYVTKFGDVQVSFYSSQKSERLVVHGANGSVAAIIDSDELKESGVSEDILKQLAMLVRRQVDKIDETIDALAQALDEPN